MSSQEINRNPRTSNCPREHPGISRHVSSSQSGEITECRFSWLTTLSAQKRINVLPSVRSGFDFGFSFVFVCCMSLSFVSSMAAMRLATELPCSRNPSVNIYTVSAKLSANDGIALLGCLLTCIRPSFWRVNRLTAYCEGVVFDEWNMVEKVVWHVYIGQHIKKKLKHLYSYKDVWRLAKNYMDHQMKFKNNHLFKKYLFLLSVAQWFEVSLKKKPSLKFGNLHFFPLWNVMFRHCNVHIFVYF